MRAQTSATGWRRWGRSSGDVYPWAGEIRTVDMHRPGSPTFCPWDRIGAEFALVTDHVQRRNRFAGVGRAEFVERTTRVYDAVNRVHAFREGNGRTQRQWLSDLARGAGYRLVWERGAGVGERSGLPARPPGGSPGPDRDGRRDH